jgi:tetratricopeptide (TPR) repeat protein
MSGWCLSEAPVPYFPFIEAFNKYVSELSDQREKSSISDRLGLTGWLRGPDRILEPEKPKYTLTPAIEKERTFDAVASTFINITSQEPHILFFDDLQWADQLSLAMIHYLAKKCRDSALFIIGTYRTEDIGRQDEVHPLVDTMFSLSRENLLQKIDLNRLSLGDFPALIDEIFHVEFSKGFIEKLYNETEGNPLFVLETLNLLIEENILVEKEGKWQLISPIDKIGIPSRVQDVISRRVSKLNREQKKIIDLAAVLGNNFSPEIISRILSINLIEVFESLIDIEQKHKLIKSAESFFEFSHQKIREVIYDNLQSGLKKIYHLQTANTLEQVLSEKISNGYLAEVAHHFIEGDSSEKAFKYLIELGEKAESLYANKEAANYMTKALEISLHHPSLATKEDLYRIYRIRGLTQRRIQIDTRLPENIENDFLNMFKAAEETGDKKILVEAYNTLGKAYNPHFGEAEEALKYYLPGLDLAKKIGYRSLEALILLNIAYIDLLISYKIDDGLKRLDEASKISKEIGDKMTESYSLRLLGQNYQRSGDFELAKEKISSSIESALIANIDPLSLVMRYMTMSMILTELGDYDEALNYSKKGLELSKEHELTATAWILNTIGWIHYHLGNWDVAIKYCTDCLDWAGSSEKKAALGGVPYSLSVLGRIYLDLKKYDLAQKYLDEALEFEHLHTSNREYPRLRGIIELGLCEIDFARENIHIIEKLDEIIFNLEKARVKKYLAQGLTLKAKILAKNGDFEGSYKIMEKVLELSRVMNSPYLYWRTHYTLGNIYKDNNEELKAREEYRKVIQLFEKTAVNLSNQSLRNCLLSKSIYQESRQIIEKAKL